VINRLRAIAEHGGMTRSVDRRRTTHIVAPSWTSRIFIAPLNVAYHLPHHVDSGVPFRNLPRLQQILIEDGYVPDDLVWGSYRGLWAAATAKRSTGSAADPSARTVEV
jgi:fatty acid desaturase